MKRNKVLTNEQYKQMKNMKKLRKHGKKLKKDKRGLQFKNAFFAVIAIGLIVTAIGVIIGEWNTQYNSGLSYDLDEYNKNSEMAGTAEGYENSLSPDSPDSGQTFESTSTFSSYGIIGNILQPFRIIFGDNGLIDSVTERFGIPDYVRYAIVTMMIFAFLFALIAIVFRLKLITPGGGV